MDGNLRIEIDNSTFISNKESIKIKIEEYIFSEKTPDPLINITISDNEFTQGFKAITIHSEKNFTNLVIINSKFLSL